MKTIEMDGEAFDDLRTAFQQNRYDTECYLDTDQGRVVWFSADSPTGEKPDEDAPDWVHEEYRERLEIWRDEDGRYLEVPPHDLSQACEDMEGFLDEMATDRLAERFDSSPMHRRTYEAFVDAVERDSRDKRKWRSYRREQVGQRIREWLELEGYCVELQQLSG